MRLKIKSFTCNDYMSMVAFVTGVVCIILYSVMDVGEFVPSVIVLFALGSLASLIGIYIKLPYLDIASFVFYTAAFFLFIESKVFYISAVFVGIDYKAFDPVFISEFIVGLINIIIAAFAALPLTKRGTENSRKK